MKKKTNVKGWFKKRFSALRAESGLSQSKLGKELSLSPATIGYYENGDRLPDIETAAKIAQYFGVSADYLLGLSDVKSIKQDIKIACEVTGLSEDSVETLQEIRGDACDSDVLNCLLSKPERKALIEILDGIGFYCDSLARKEIFIEVAKEEFKFTAEREQLAYKVYWDFSSRLVSWWYDFHGRVTPEEEQSYLLPNFDDFAQYMRREFYEYCIKEKVGIAVQEIAKEYIAKIKSEKKLHNCYVKALNAFLDIKEKYISEVEEMEKQSEKTQNRDKN